MKIKELRNFSLKSSIVVVDLFFNNYLSLALVGFLNKNIFRNKIKSTFLVYPAKKKYIKDYTFNWFSKRNKWNPFIIGFFKQKGRIGVVFAVPAGEGDFNNDQNIPKLQKMVEVMEKKKALLGAELKNFAGVLPGVLSKREILKDTKEAKLTVIAVFRALEALAKEEFLGEEYKVLILGGKGFIGKRLVDYLSKLERFNERVLSIDIDNLDNAVDIFNSLRESKVIVLNITKKSALSDFINFLNKNTIVLNEVYPEPSEQELEEINKRSAKCYHIVGLKGKVFPSFPGAYKRGVPCCASFVSCEKDDIIIKKLV